MADDEMRDDPADGDDKPAAVSRAALAAGAGGGVVGGAGASLLTGEGSSVAATTGLTGPSGVPLAGSGAGPAGVPMTPGVGVGNAGVPFSHGAVVGPAGVPIADSSATAATGVPMGTGSASGPVGVGLVTPVKVARRGRTIGLVSAGVVAVAAVATVAALSGGDDAPIASNTVVAVESTTATQGTVTASSVTASTAPGPVDGLVGPACTVGSWIADNEIFGSRFSELSGMAGTVAVSGEVRLDIAADGAAVTTFTDFRISTTVPELGSSAEVSESGPQTSTIVFGEDGSYAVSNVVIGSTQEISSDGVVYFSGPSPQAAFEGGSTYTCAGDELVMHVAAEYGDFDEVFQRSG